MEEVKSQVSSLIEKLMEGYNKEIDEKLAYIDNLESQRAQAKSEAEEAQEEAARIVNLCDIEVKKAYNRMDDARNELAQVESLVKVSQARYDAMEQGYKDKESDLRGKYAALEKELAGKLTEGRDRLFSIEQRINILKSDVAGL